MPDPAPPDTPTAYVVCYYTTDEAGVVWDYQSTDRLPFAAAESEAARLTAAGYGVDVWPCWGPG